MTHWMCVKCGYYLQDSLPPKKCPGCNQVCIFSDVTCYRPECGGERNIDPLLVGSILGSLTPTKIAAHKPAAVATQGNMGPTGEILSGLNENQRSKVRSLGLIEAYKKDAVICREGEQSPKLYIVEEGQATVQAEVGTGMSIPLTTVSEGQAFGWSFFVPPFILTASVVASTDIKVLAIEREPLLALMRSDSSLGLILMQNIASIIALRLRNVELELSGLIKQTRKK
jgi:CRP-like cAMP-binding protein